jgi:hypothetical protein
MFRPTGGQVGKYCSKNCCDLDKIVSKSRVVCEECGITFEKDRWKVDFTTKMFCSRKCYAKNFNRRSPKVDLMVCWLKELGLKVEEEKSFPWLKNPNGYNLYLDVFVPDKLLAIEYDGRHHYKPTFEKDNSAIVLYRQTLDKLKDKLCSKYCITLIRFRYDEPFDKKHFLNKLEFVV